MTLNYNELFNKSNENSNPTKVDCIYTYGTTETLSVGPETKDDGIKTRMFGLSLNFSGQTLFCSYTSLYVYMHVYISVLYVQL